MPATAKERLKSRAKQTFISLGVYGPVRRIYDRINADRATAIGEVRDVYSRFVRAGDLCFDVGANVGVKTSALLRLGARVVAVEPQPLCLRELKALYGQHPRLTLVPKAVGRAPGTAKLHVSSRSGLSSLHADWFESESVIEVELTTLDALIEAHGVPRLLKIDIEGYELEALNGLSQPVEIIVFEYNAGHPDRALACVDYLERFGEARFNLARMDDSRMLSETWWDRATFLEKFQEELARHQSWGGDIYVHLTAAAR